MISSHLQMPRRYLALWFPFLSANRLQRVQAREAARSSVSVAPDKCPLVFASPVKGAMRLAAVSRAAMKIGLHPGLTLADARARFPNMEVAPNDPAADSALLDAMLEDCDRWTMLVSRDDPSGLILDITGCAHLFGGEARMRESIIRRFARAGLETRATVAGTPDAARALARYGHVEIVPTGGEADVVGPLPVAALESQPEAHLALVRAGLKTLGELASRSSQPLTARFGAALTTKLHRVLGFEDRRITPFRSPPVCVVERTFPEPITHIDAINPILKQLVARAADLLEKRGEGGRFFEASFFRTDGEVRRVSVGTGRPTSTQQTIMRLFAERLDTLADPLDPGFGFDLMRLAVPATEPLEPPQPSFDGKVTEAHEVSDLVDRLVARFGTDAVLRFAAADTHNPLRASRLVRAAGLTGPLKGALAVEWQEPEPNDPPTRPLRLFDPPEPIDTFAEIPDGPPIRFRWRRVLHDVMRAEGPERIAAEWWRKPNVPTRDYFRVEDKHGRRFWVFREGHYNDAAESPRWFLHGLFA